MTDINQNVHHQSSSISSSTDKDHPILGPIILDLGYNTIYCLLVRYLKTLPVLEQPRAYRHDRAKLMVTDKLKCKDIGLAGIISLYEVSNSISLVVPLLGIVTQYRDIV